MLLQHLLRSCHELTCTISYPELVVMPQRQVNWYEILVIRHSPVPHNSGDCQAIIAPSSDLEEARCTCAHGQHSNQLSGGADALSRLLNTCRRGY